MDIPKLDCPLAAPHQRKHFVLTFIGLFALGISAHAAITAVDDTNPIPADGFWAVGGDPADTYTSIFIGESVASGGGVTGSLTVDSASSLTTGAASIGEGLNTYGSATVSGLGSTWTVLKDPSDINDDGEIAVGSEGKGELTIENFASVTANDIYISDSTTADGTVLVDSSATLAVNQTIEVGYENTGALTIQDSAQVDAYNVLVGVESTANGTLTVTNDGTLNVGTEQVGETYLTPSQFTIGDFGTGAMTVTDGGEVNSLESNIGLNVGSVGTVTVGGAGAAADWNVTGNLGIGNEGTGTLTISSNGTVDVSGETQVGEDGGTGSIVFVGGGVLNTGTLAAAPSDLSGTGVINASGLAGVVNTATFNAANTYTEALGTITVNLTADGNGDLFDTNLDVNGSGVGGPIEVAFGNLGLGDEFGDSHAATITGPDITLAITNTAEVGFGGSGTVNVEAGGAMTAKNVLIGEESGSFGEVIVTGAGSTLDVTSIFLVGNAGEGNLEVNSGGAITAGSLNIAYQAGSSGEVLVDAGTLDVTGNMTLGNGAFADLAIENAGVVTVGGTTTVNNGVIFFDNAGNGVLNTGSLVLDSIDDVEGNGTINTSGITGIIAKATFDGDNANDQLYTENLDTSYIDENTLLPVVGTTALNLTADGNGDLREVDLEVRDGADVSFGRVLLAQEVGDTNTALVTGANSVLNVYDTFIGQYGTGIMTIDQGGELDATWAIQIANFAGSSGTLLVRNGSYVESEALLVGWGGAGTMEVSGGSVFQGVINSYVSIGGNFGSGASADVTVDGAGSELNSSHGIDIYETGNLTVSNGAVVNQTGVTDSFYVTDGADVILSNGTINATTLSTTDPGAFSGTGTINANGIADLYSTVTFNGSNSFSTTLAGGGIDLNVVANGNGMFNVDTLNVINGASISTSHVTVDKLFVQGPSSNLDAGTRFVAIGTELGVDGGAQLDAGSLTLNGGFGVVEGSGSQVNLAYELYVGNFAGSIADLFIEDGAAVSARSIYINRANAAGEVEVEVIDANSSLTATNSIYVGHNGGTADLHVLGGASVSAGDDIIVGSDGVINMMVYGNNQLNSGTDGTGGIQNEGDVNLFAYANLAADVYTPISTGSGTSADLTGSGNYNAFGGTWDQAAMTFTVSTVVDGSGGLTNADLDGARVSFDGGNLLVGFADGADGDANFNAVEVTGVASIGGFSTLQVYSFTTDMVFGVDEQVLLSFNVGEGYESEFFEFWHRTDAGSEWTLLDPDTATYAGGWVNFTVSSFSDYAVTVPEPQAFALIFGVLALCSAVTRRRRK